MVDYRLNHSIDVGCTVFVRWYSIEKPTGLHPHCGYFGAKTFSGEKETGTVAVGKVPEEVLCRRSGVPKTSDDWQHGGDTVTVWLFC